MVQHPLAPLFAVTIFHYYQLTIVTNLVARHAGGISTRGVLTKTTLVRTPTAEGRESRWTSGKLIPDAWPGAGQNYDLPPPPRFFTRLRGPTPPPQQPSILPEVTNGTAVGALTCLSLLFLNGPSGNACLTIMSRPHRSPPRPLFFTVAPSYHFQAKYTSLRKPHRHYPFSDTKFELKTPS